MNNRGYYSERKALFAGALILVLSCCAISSASTKWIVAPAYESDDKGAPKPFSIVDENKVEHVFYNASNAILIIEGGYNSAWTAVKAQAASNEKLLRDSLEERGFHVVVWRDLGAADLKTVLNDSFTTLGNIQNSRLFFYYYGHGRIIESDDDTSPSTAFLVPVDTPDPVTDEGGFYRSAIPVSQLVEYAKEMRAKHAFFALEACRAGAVIASLSGGLEPPNPKGYLLNPKIQKPIKYFLTAGSADEDIAATNAFTPLLVGALTGADANDDGYVTGSEVINYVSQKLPQFATRQSPEHGSWPYAGGGDMVFGPSATDKPAPAVASPIVKTTIVTRDWVLPGLNVGCNETKSGRVEATVELDPRYDERVLSVTSSLRDVDNVKGPMEAVLESPPSQRVVIRYRFNGLDAGLLGCPGGGHATLAATFTIERKEIGSASKK